MTSVILVHGALHGAWCWDRVVAELQSHGVEVLALDLPGNGVDDTALADATLQAHGQYVVTMAATLPPPRMLVAHSAGGLAISAALELDPAAFAKAIYLTAMLPVDGDNFATIKAIPVEDQITIPLVAAPDGASFSISPEAASPYFFNTCSPEDAAAASRKLTPQPLRPMMEPIRLTSERFGSVEKIYIKCGKDLAFPPALQDYLIAKYPGIRVHELPTDHSPFISAPVELTAILLQEMAA